MDQPFISVIVPSYNAAGTIGGCINSLLAQSYPKERYEVIVVDNGSSDRTPEIIKKFPVRYIHESRIRTSYAARNAGLPYAKGEIIAFTDSDCIADDKWLAQGVKNFEDEKVGCVAGGIQSPPAGNCVEAYLGKGGFLSQRESHKFFDFLPFAQTANAFYRRNVFKETGNFKSAWKSGGDADLCWRMQLETGYKLEFDDSAQVLHKHRSTIKGLFGQFLTHGEGQACLYKAYPAQLDRPGLKASCAALLRLLRSFFKCVGVTDRSLEKMPPRAREERIRTVIFTARTLGRIKGGIKNGMFFV